MKQRHSRTVKVQVELWKEGEDSYVATCPQLGCIFVHEESGEAAYRHAREAIEAYLETAIEYGDPIPEEVMVNSGDALDTCDIHSCP